MVSFYLSKTDGAIKLVDIFQQPAGGPFIIEDDSSGKWFYHRVQWVDMDGDGDKDVVTCHAKEPIIGQKASELLWLENPNSDISIKWKTHIVGIGPDVFFRKPTIVLSGDDEGTAYLLTPLSEDPKNWSYNQTFFLRTGSDTVGQMACADVDGNGHKELFIPSYSTSEVFVFTF